MTFSDPRSQCWVNAVTSLESAQKRRNDPQLFENQILLQQYWMLMAEANIFATLASADSYTGLGSGHLLAQQQQDEMERQRIATDLHEKVQAKKKRMGAK